MIWNQASWVGSITQNIIYIYQNEPFRQDSLEKMDYESIMAHAMKAGPLMMKVNLMRWKKMTAAILVRVNTD